MTREDTQSSQIISVKPAKAKLCKFIFIITFTVAIASTFYISKDPLDLLDELSDKFVVKNAPKFYTNPESIDPEERDVFQGFQTSFLPPEEDILFREKSDDIENHENIIFGDMSSWDSVKKETVPYRVKRKSSFPVYSESYEEDDSKYNSEIYEDDEELSTEANGELDSNEYEDDGSLKSVIHREIYVDRGPLDDVEQVRRQPELEEEEMSSAARLHKPVPALSGIHAFWKGQGNKDSIRATQANIMKQYMDAEADPCHDFYQYACGNWPVLNPIPADKAGYDTFEMLRENLDTVLKELLELKKNEVVLTSYPGPHLDLHDDIFNYIHHCKYIKNADHNHLHVDVIVTSNSKEDINYTVVKNTAEHKDAKSQIVNRIKRYLNLKERKNIKNRKKVLSKHDRKIRDLDVTNLFKENVRHNLVHRNHAFSSDNTVNFGRQLNSYEKVKRRKKSIETFLQKMKKSHKPFNDPANGDAAMKARFLFKSCMNHDILEKRGHQPLLDLLEILGGWHIIKPNWKSENFDWLELMAKLRLFNNDILISEWVGPDIKKSDEFVIQFDQTSLGLPTRDYFLQPSNKIYLDAYKAYLIKIAMLLGGGSAHVKESAEKLIEFETKLARITSAPEDRRNVSELYRRMSLGKLENLVPQVKWRKYLCIVMNRTVQSQETVVLFALSYVRHLVKLIDKTDPKTLSDYMLWRFVRHRVNNLDDRFQTVKQQFYYILFGREQAPPRWKNCISQVNSNMGMALGSMFVRKYFDEISKNDTLTMTREIQQAFKELLQLTDWIDEDTKKLAAHKVETMMLRIGYPDFILNKADLDERYKEIKVHPDKYFENILNILQHLTKMEQTRIGQPVNKTLWNTAPAVVNAYYSRNKNQIMFPAGILQPPFYHRHFPRSLNFGGIGVVIGHEITHGFDDKGRLFDCEGNLHRWWSDSAIDAFHKRAQCLIDQYGKYVVPEVNMKLDGINTQGENIADNGGVKQAFHAYLHWLQHHDPADETLPGINHTHTQLFFLNFAQVWCGAMRPEAMRNKLKTAVHSPGRFRVIGTLSNSQDFAREFNCPPGSPMNPTQKCNVW